MPNKISKATRSRLMIIMRELAHEARIDEYVVQHIIKANPKVWIQKARQHVAAQKARRREVQSWPTGYPRLDLGMRGGLRRGDFYAYAAPAQNDHTTKHYFSVAENANEK